MPVLVLALICGAGASRGGDKQVSGGKAFVREGYGGSGGRGLLLPSSSYALGPPACGGRSLAA
jgi:hypothetical protein